MRIKELDYLDLIAQAIYDKKGKNIIAIDVRNFSTLTDYVLIAEGYVDRHVTALCQTVIDTLEEQGVKLYHAEGTLTGDWAVLDFGSINVHIMSPDMREKYTLEELWRPGKIVQLKIEITQRGQNE